MPRVLRKKKHYCLPDCPVVGASLPVLHVLPISPDMPGFGLYIFLTIFFLAALALQYIQTTNRETPAVMSFSDRARRGYCEPPCHPTWQKRRPSFPFQKSVYFQSAPVKKKKTRIRYGQTGRDVHAPDGLRLHERGIIPDEEQNVRDRKASFSRAKHRKSRRVASRASAYRNCVSVQKIEARFCAACVVFYFLSLALSLSLSLSCDFFILKTVNS